MGSSVDAEGRRGSGRLRELPVVLRRLYRLTRDIDVIADAALLAELNQRTIAITHRIDHLSAVLEQADPQATLDIVIAVRDSVRELTVELTEQANLTSELLANLAEQGQSKLSGDSASPAVRSV